MSKVTSKLQVTVPKSIAEAYSIEPGADIEWVPAGDSIRVLPPGQAAPTFDPKRRLELFDKATERQRGRNQATWDSESTEDRGWRREELYGNRGAR